MKSSLPVNMPTKLALNPWIGLMVGKSFAPVKPETKALHADAHPGSIAILVGVAFSLGPLRNVEYMSVLPVGFNSVTNPCGKVVKYAPAVVGKSETATVPVT